MDSNQITVKDNLQFINDPEIKNIINDEQILFSGKITKVNRYGFSQERNILITNKSIYNLKKKGKNIYE